MVDIFSSFDPATSTLFGFSPMLFWAMNVITVLIIAPIFWISPSSLFWLLTAPMTVMSQQASRTNLTHLKGLETILVALFIFIIATNFMGIAPYVFSASSHLVFTFAFGLPLWLSLILSSAIYSPSSTLAALLPGGAPSWLNPFLILIETVSTAVRPITLSVRLAANMSAGHIVLTLIGVYFVYSSLSSSFFLTIILFFIQMGYTVFEMGICMIQAYIFCLLTSL
uniref:ATP synthase subunit a n=1 Tax=Prionospio multibranchiata TaxID=3050093 RepID=A0AAU6QGE1_9ANNE